MSGAQQSDRHPLTQRTARTVAQTRRDPFDFWEGKREPQHIIAVDMPGSPRVQRLIEHLLKEFRK